MNLMFSLSKLAWAVMLWRRAPNNHGLLGYMMIIIIDSWHKYAA